MKGSVVDTPSALFHNDMIYYIFGFVLNVNGFFMQQITCMCMYH